jgi:hypothetical protein
MCVIEIDFRNKNYNREIGDEHTVIDMKMDGIKRVEHVNLWFLIFLVFIIAIIGNVYAEVNYEFDHQDPAGDVLDFNETWHNVGTVDSEPQIDLKWLRSSNDTLGNVELRMEFKNNQIIEQSDDTKYVFRIFTSQDNSTGYNITYINSSATISNLNNTIEEDMTANMTIIDDKGEVLVVTISKARYLDNITFFNADAYTWKEGGNHTFIDYISEVPGHPGETGTVVDGENGDTDEDEGLLGLLCSLTGMLCLAVLIIIIVVVVILIKR